MLTKNNVLKSGVAKRETNFELLRILSMIMVIVLHIGSYTNFVEDITLFSVNGFIFILLRTVSFVAVNLYVLISGYFLCTSKFKIKKLITLCVEVLFYSIVIYFFCVATGFVKFDIKEFITVVLPISSSRYWFITVYVGLYILSPFINICINALSKSQMKKAILIFVGLFSVIPTMFLGKLDTFKVEGGFSLTWFIVLYFIGSYIRLHVKQDMNTIKHSKKKYVCIYSLSIFILMLSAYIMPIINEIVFAENKIKWIFYKYNSILMLILAVSLFMLFRSIKIKSSLVNKIILLISPVCFSVYLIHDNYNLRKIIWDFVKTHSTGFESPLFIPYCLIVVLIIFIGCIAIGYIRKLVFKRFEKGPFLDNVINAITNSKVVIAVKNKLDL